MASPRRAALCLALCLLVLPRPPAAAAQITNLTAGTALAPPGYITSPSGVFAFGFRALDSDPTQFILATWFRLDGGAANGSSGNSSSPTPPQNVVWFAKKADTGATPLATALSALSVTPDGQLALMDGANGSSSVLWSPPANSSVKRASVLALLDSGDLRLIADGGGVLWQSFAHPRDTLLLGQSVAWDAGATGKLVSKRTDAEFTTGRFSLGVQADGNVVLYVDLLDGNDPDNSYWQAHTNGGGGGTVVSFDEPGRLYYTLRNGTVQNLVPPMPNSTLGKYYQFARMDPDGIVRVYARPKNGGGNASWTVSGAFPSNGCSRRTSGLHGLCGPGSYCVETKDRLSCECPSGYTYIDPQHRDTGCAPEFAPQGCGAEDGDPAAFALVEVPNTTWETSLHYEELSPATADQCRDYCLNDCFCAAALITGGTKCIEMAALTNGRQANDPATKALIKVRTTKTPAASSPGTRTILHYRIIAGCLAFLSLATIGGLLAQLHLNRKNTARHWLLGVRAFSWKELYRATNGFEKLLGRGSFGEVYQGVLKSPGLTTQPIAVKRLVASNEYSEREFANEVQSLGQIHHRNLVRMVGYCKEGRHRMLVLEFMPGGSLRGALFKPGARPPWRWRAEAALGIARGIEYLHDGCASPIIHCDIKPDNILLDGECAPRITDFGISKLLGGERVHATVTNVRGTRGYIAPEWLRGEARVDTKADVYSFGVVLLEMICCRRCQEPVPDHRGAGDETVTLFGWAGQLVGARRTELMLRGDDDDATAAEEDLARVERYSRVALWCMEPNPALRPTMHQVARTLEGTVDAEAPPDPPGCYLESSPLIPIADKKQ
ncbi:hypothetical protein GQ55_4G063600 [Panicum hallii var. hallii]|uniref:Receptor-like serine/threonine-protein kinase n=1 Tax=Panicum hallii var. hallii TaxID=1504633 RepID=A0A2T7DVV0_9POAL|nr:hypothetical protein GQ55_4G063600 [Panicum hallii var. hallii]